MTTLQTDLANKTPQELLRRYAWHLVGIGLLVVLFKSFAYSIVSVLAAGAMVCLVVGLFNPQAFRRVFGERTSKAMVGGTFGLATLLLGAIGSNLEPKAIQSEPAPVLPRPSAIAPVLAPAPRVAPQLAGEKSPTGQVSLAQKEVPKPEKTVRSTPSAAVSPAPPVGSASQAKRVAPLPVPPKLTPQQVIEEAMQDQFGDRLRQIEVRHLVRDLYSVRVEFNNRLRLTVKTTKNYMEGDMQDAYKAIFTSGLNITEASVKAFGAGKDKYGQPFSAPAYATLLSRDVASKINWKDHRAARWDDLWTVTFLHRQYRDENLGRNWDKEAAEAKKSLEPAEVEKEMRRRQRAGEWPYQ